MVASSSLLQRASSPPSLRRGEFLTCSGRFHMMSSRFRRKSSRFGMTSSRFQHHTKHLSPSSQTPVTTSTSQWSGRVIRRTPPTSNPSTNRMTWTRPHGSGSREGSGSEGSLKGHDPAGKQLTPENGGGGQGGASRAKRRLVMHTTEGNRGGGRREVMDRPPSSTPEAAVQSHSQESQQLKQLQLTHAGQVRALKEEQRRQQQQLLQSPRCLSVCYGPLVAAAVKGYLTRRLLHTERVGQLLCTIKDTQQFLQSFQPQSPGRDSRQDLVLQERVTLQLRSARYEVQDIFCLSAGDRMQIISWDRQLARDREMRRKTGETGSTRGKTSLSAATQKALERKRGVMMRKAAEGQRGTGAGVVAGQKGPLAGAEGTGAGVVAGQKGPLAGAEGNVVKQIRGSFRPNPQRVPKTTQSRRSR
ncbi:centriolar coiled-coil protein of 110 kDa-like isoform X2 [Oncorhynchus kisutch]|uniref:centriolar coiled-coil protein of 110 kDa-like isoform X2 n=1 Tax=Oncorhynchus kisutch TaxID=8019 RepID=UPI0012DC5068|nr:centriolar coiled-coil protein of 110 kDa-like isoform X2 [Oncorhynchus kisutch]